MSDYDYFGYYNVANAATVSNNISIGTYTDNTTYPYTYPIYKPVFIEPAVAVPAPDKPKRARKPRAQDPLAWLRQRVAEVSWTPA